MPSLGLIYKIKGWILSILWIMLGFENMRKAMDTLPRKKNEYSVLYATFYQYFQVLHRMPSIVCGSHFEKWQPWTRMNI